MRFDIGLRLQSGLFPDCQAGKKRQKFNTRTIDGIGIRDRFGLGSITVAEFSLQWFGSIKSAENLICSRGGTGRRVGFG